jgi:hypothetical protein
VLFINLKNGVDDLQMIEDERNHYIKNQNKSATACGTITRRLYLWIIEAIWERIRKE